jgi:hypothetical protein
LKRAAFRCAPAVCHEICAERKTSQNFNTGVAEERWLVQSLNAAAGSELPTRTVVVRHRLDPMVWAPMVYAPY